MWEEATYTSAPSAKCKEWRYHPHTSLLSIVVHDREAHGKVLEFLSGFEGRVEGVMHCFSGSREMAEQCVRYGFYISFAGPVTLPNAHRLQAIARWIDLSKIPVEADSPWLAPQEFRGKRNEPAFLPFIAKKIAKRKGISLGELAEATTRNAKEIFQLEWRDVRARTRK